MERSFEAVFGKIASPSYVRDEGRSLDGVLQEEPPNRPKRLRHNVLGRERWGKGIVKDGPRR